MNMGDKNIICYTNDYESSFAHIGFRCLRLNINPLNKRLVEVHNFP